MPPRDITVTFDDGSQQIYRGVPENVMPAQVEQRAMSENAGKKITQIDGGRSITTPNAPSQPSIADRAAGLLQYGYAAPVVAASRAAMGGLNDITDAVGSGATEAASQAGLSPEAAGAIGTVANLGASSLIPGAVAKGATSLSPVMESAATRLMQSAVKPNLAARESGNANKAIQTMLNWDINATSGGYDKVKGKIGELENTIQSILDQSPATVDKFEVAKNLKNAVQQVNLNLDRAQNIKDIQDAFTKFWDHDALKNLGNNIPVALANKMKQAFYKELMDKVYQPGAQVSAGDKAQKALAAGLREQAGKVEPAITEPMAQQSELINVAKVLAPRVGVEGNKNVGGLGVLAPSTEQFLAWMLDRSPWAKSYLARTLYHGSERIPAELAGGVTAAGMGAERNK